MESESIRGTDAFDGEGKRETRRGLPARRPRREAGAWPISRFITLEGGERSGKSTQARLLQEALVAAGQPTILLREPGSTPLGERLRAMILSGEFQPSPRAEALLLAAARAELVETVIRPALGSGTWVVCDRFSDSSLAYQGAALGLGIDAIRTLNDWATGNLRPDLTLLLDLDPDVAGRREEARDAIAARGRLFHDRVRAAYLELAAAEPERFVVIDARVDADEVRQRAWEAVSRLLEGRRCR